MAARTATMLGSATRLFGSTAEMMESTRLLVKPANSWTALDVLPRMSGRFTVGKAEFSTGAEVAALASSVTVADA